MTPSVAPRLSGQPSLFCATLPLLAASAGHAGRRDAPQHPPGTAIASAHALATDAGLEMIRARRQRLRCRGRGVGRARRWSSRSAPASAAAASSCCTMRKTGRDVFVDARETAPESATPAGVPRREGRTRPRPRRQRPVVGRHSRPARGAGARRAEVRPPAADDHAGAGDPHRARRFRGLSAPGKRLRQPPRGDGALPPARARCSSPMARRRRPARSSSSPTSRARWNCWRRRASMASIAAKSRRSCWPAVEGRRRQVDAPTNSPATASSEREPLRFKYRDWDVTTAPPPSSGGVALARDAADARRLGPGEARRRASHAPHRRSDAPRVSAIARSTSAIPTS